MGKLLALFPLPTLKFFKKGRVQKSKLSEILFKITKVVLSAADPYNRAVKISAQVFAVVVKVRNIPCTKDATIFEYSENPQRSANDLSYLSLSGLDPRLPRLLSRLLNNHFDFLSHFDNL